MEKMAMSKFLTQVWCLPGMTKARLTVASEEEYHSVNLDADAIRATIVALQQAERRVSELEAALRGKCDCGHVHDRDNGCGDCSCDLWTCAALANEKTP